MIGAVSVSSEDWKFATVCSIASQGLLLRMHFIAQNSERPGYLQLNGTAIRPEGIATECGLSLDQYLPLRKELDEYGITKISADGISFIPSLLTSEKEKAESRKRQKKTRQNKPRHSDVTRDMSVTQAQSPVLGFAFDPSSNNPKIETLKPQANVHLLEQWFPEWMTQQHKDAFMAYARMRKDMGKRMQPETIQRKLGKLTQMHLSGIDVVKEIQRATDNNWLDFYPEGKTNGSGKGNHSKGGGFHSGERYGERVPDAEF